MRKRSLTSFCLTSLGLTAFNLAIALAMPAYSAEKIILRYGPLEFTLRRESLEHYAEKGTIAPDLDDFTTRLNKNQRQQLREVLSAKAELDTVAVSQFFYSTQGEAILNLLGKVVQTRSGESGFYALRSALILASADEKGLTPLNIIKKFPTSEILLNSASAFDLLNQASQSVQMTQKAIAAIESEVSNTDAVQGDFPLDLQVVGETAYTKITLILNDRDRDRAFPADLYLPDRRNLDLSPLIIISHGLGSDRQTYTYLAQHLASHGFAVAVPEHSGSNSQQLQNLAKGLVQDISPPREFIDRPLDIRFLLDRLAEKYGHRLNSQRVGVLGQSFGGYTALALAGAELNFPQLEAQCQLKNYSLNLSLLLQCPAQALAGQKYTLHDDRIAAVMAINPITSSVFGDAGMGSIQIPTAIVTGSADTVAPALAEQILPFTALVTLHKYLILLKGGTHFSTLGISSDDIALPPRVIGPDPAIARDYMKALGLAFFGAYIAGDSQYESYLSADYTRHLQRPEMPVSLVKSLLREQLN
ncbi:alpha/beta hydrolase [Spirulina sp. 06S082]|uniref:alpha/beta hydrolase n=1 Tax=Spirulina sp. 06S082 TaxID=3110248 RepID=UPI002B1EC557|nr:alpha/beta hydrolase [Spirulina sp. 06S082]MEA5467783.1 alpha/beta hydrolase [Spirulina sp. 06S082]